MKKNLILLLVILAIIPGIASALGNSSPSSYFTDHFVVAYTGNGINHMNINILDAKVGGVSMESGDEIAAFDGSICVGVIRLTTTFTAQTLAASQASDGLANGYTPGHPIIIKLWDSSTGTEISSVSVMDNTGNTISPTYIDRGSALVRLAAKAEMTVQIGADNKVYDGSTTATVPTGSIVKEGVASGQVVEVTVTNAHFDNKNTGTNKTVTADISISGADAVYYNVNSTASTTASITGRPITIKAESKTKVYGTSDPALTASISQGNIISGDVATGTLTRANGSNVGDYAISQGTYTYGSNYTESFVSDNLTITPMAVTVTANAANKMMGDSDPVLTYSCSPLLLGSDAFTGALSRAPGEDLGNYAINQGTLSAGTNYTISFVGAQFTIKPRYIVITVTATAKTKTYGSNDPALTYTYSPELNSGDSFTGSLAREAGESAGNYAINQGTLALGSAYRISYVGATFTIAKSNLSIVAQNLTKCAGSELTFSGTEFTANGLINSDVVTHVSLASTGAAASAVPGTYAIIPSRVDGTGLSNYNINLTQGQLTVNALPTAAISGTTVICPGQSATLTLTLTGKAPWTLTVTDGTNSTVFSDITSSPKTFSVTPPANTAKTYQIVSVSDANGCSNSGTGSASVSFRSTIVAPVASSSQTICYGSSANTLTATAASGASGSFRYQWQKSIDTYNWEDIPSADGLSYFPGLLTKTTYYRIFAMDSDCGGIASTYITITVHDQVKDCVALGTQTICKNGTPSALTATAPIGGNGVFLYQWQTLVSGNWIDVPGADQLTYQPGALTSTTTYRVIANDNGISKCGSTSSNEITINVMAETLPGQISGDQTILTGATPEPIVSVLPGSGSGIITYSWESSIDAGAHWTPIIGEAGAGYTPGTLTQSTQFRRITVASEEGSTCIAVTDPVMITVHGNGIDLNGNGLSNLNAFAVEHVGIMIKGEIHQPASATVYDVQGRIVITTKLKSGNENILSTEGLKTGVYVLFINNDNSTQRFKIPVKE